MADIINNAMPPVEDLKAEVPEVMKRAVEEAAAAPPHPAVDPIPAPPAADASNVVDVWNWEWEEKQKLTELYKTNGYSSSPLSIPL